MQDCFRLYPDIYGAELEDDDEDMSAEELETPASSTSTAVASALAPESKPVESSSASQTHSAEITDPPAAAQTSQMLQPDAQVHPDQESSATDRSSEKDEEIPKP
jgi:mitochondrial intermembrane space import and assembly protein 40